jgi:hypothetical protein
MDSTASYVFALLIAWAICGVLSAIIASGKGREPAGWFFVGALLGPLGVVIALVIGEPSFTNRVSNADDLTKLADLRDRGALTESEFQTEKRKLLG